MAFINRPRVTLDSGPQLDAFNRLRTSSPTNVFNSKLLFDKRPFIWDEVLVNGATSVHSSVNAAVTMSVSSAGDIAVRQTFQRFNYQPGKSQLVLLTGVMSTESGVTKEIGYAKVSTCSPYAIQNGIVFGNNGTSAYVAIYKNGVQTEIALQDDWNIDPMDGTGPSEITIDWTKAQIFLCDFQWLGIGSVRMGLEINGNPYYVHTFHHSNIVSSVYMSTPNLPLVYKISSSGGSGSLDHICSAVSSEGGVAESGVTRGIDRGGSSSAPRLENLVNDRLTAAFGIRLKSSYEGAAVQILKVIAQNVSGGNFLWQIHYNPTIRNFSAGTTSDTLYSPTWTSLNDSAVEYVNDSNANKYLVRNNDEGRVIASGYVSNNLDSINIGLENDRYLGFAIDGTPDELWIVIESDESGDEYHVGLIIRELY